MESKRWTTVFANTESPLIGMVHLQPLPGSPKWLAGSWDSLAGRAMREAERLAEAGFDGIMMENFNDVPFYPGRVPVVTVAAMTALAVRVQDRIRPLPLGINVLRNDGESALAVAAAAGAQFIRVNVLSGAMVTDQGVIAGIAHTLLRERAQLGPHIAIVADVHVKHAVPLGAWELEAAAEDTFHRGLADALVASGRGTGQKTDPGDVARIKRAVPQAPVLVGSGAVAGALEPFRGLADGFIVGSALKVDGSARNEIDPIRARAFVRAWRNGGNQATV